jgi:hypothetical protein
MRGTGSIRWPHWVLTIAQPTHSSVEAMTVNLINGKMSGIVKEKLMFILHAICVQMTHLSVPSGSASLEED